MVISMYDFHQILGHESVKEHLQNAIASKKVSHAYILHGEEGSGKTLLAMSFAKTLQCEKGGSSPCNHCVSCKQVETNNHPDIMWVTHEKASIGVDDIRDQVNGNILIKPYQSPYKIYIIGMADKMTEAAQNALLKTLEEPPEYGVIILLANNINRILATVLSRSVVLNLRPIDSQLIKDFLMTEHHIPDYMARIAADFSGGNVGKAIKYATSEEFEGMKSQVLHILKYIDEMGLYEIVSGIKTITANKGYIDDYLDLILLWYRDVLMQKATNDPNLLTYKEEYQHIKGQAKKRSYNQIENIINSIEKAKLRLQANVNIDIALELMLLSIKENS